MAIPKNAVNFRAEAEALSRALDRYEETATWALARNNVTALITANMHLHEHRASVNAIMAGRRVTDFKLALMDVFGLDAAAWTSFQASAANVHANLVPAAILAIESNAASILAQSFDAVGRPQPSGSLSAAAAVSIRAALQAIIAEYV